MLHPLWRSEEQYSNAELEEGFLQYVRRITGDDVDMMRRIEDDLLAYRNNSLHFGRPTARLRETQLQPVSWWEKYGNCAPTLVCASSFFLLINLSYVVCRNQCSLILALLHVNRNALPFAFSHKTAALALVRETGVLGLSSTQRRETSSKRHSWSV